LIRSVAYRSGSQPEQTPAFAAVELSLMRTFGRWQLQPRDAGSPLDAGRSSVLVEALARRLALREVQVHLGCPIEGIMIRDGRVRAVRTTNEERPAAAVVATCNPWQTFNVLLPVIRGRRSRRRLHDLNPGAGPTIAHHSAPRPTSLVTETVTFGETGVPAITYLRQGSESGIRTDHDYNRSRPQPSYGVAWNGFASWLRRPAVTTEVSGVYTAGPFSPAGPAASHVVLSAALAAYGCHDYLAATR